MIERSDERDAALAATLPHVPAHGWTRAALRHGLANPADADLLFPGGPAALVEAWADLQDRRMLAAMAARDTTALRLPGRLRLAIALRLEAARPHREAARRAAALLALPPNAAAAARVLARTVDALWLAAGDRSADFSWYTKRFILAGLWSATFLHWLADPGEDDAATLAFLDRRLAGQARFHRARRRCGEAVARLLPGEPG
jgi:ubiquinone biosynthesis protein COQ9